MRLLSFFQHHVGLSRRKAFALIQSGAVMCNAHVLTSSKDEVVEGDRIVVGDDHRIVPSESASDALLLDLVMFFKPLDVVVSTADPHNDTIYSVLPERYSKYYYIGKLDKNSDGLLLLANDRTLVDALQHPRHNIDKVYIVTLSQPWNVHHTSAALTGVWVDENGDAPVSGGPAALLRCSSIEALPEDPCMVRIVLQEGKKRHIRRMLRGLHYHIHALRRISFGPFHLDGLKAGECRPVPQEILADFLGSHVA